MPPRSRASTRLLLTISAPTIAPTSIERTAPERRTVPFPEPPAKRESADRPVSVIVSTVVVRSGTPRPRTVALRTPIASASSAMIASPVTWSGRTSTIAANSPAITTSPTSIASVAVIRRRRRSAVAVASLPPATAPSTNASAETSGAITGRPAVPAIPNPSSTTFPVMLALNTRPRPI